MAHIHDLAQQVSAKSNYVAGRKTGNQLKFPETDVFQGFNAPSRLEGEIMDLEVEGIVPPEVCPHHNRQPPRNRMIRVLG